MPRVSPGSADLILATLLLAAPSAPGSIRFSELTTTSVNVSWEPPPLPNGILEGYRLVYEPCMPVDGEGMAGTPGGGWEHWGELGGLQRAPGSASVPAGVSKIVTVDVKGNSPLWMKVKDLAEGVTYRFRIRAKTFAYGPDVEANITTGPGEGTGGHVGCRARAREEMTWGHFTQCHQGWHGHMPVCTSSSALGPQVPPVPPASPSSPAMARLSPSIGRVGIPAKGPSPDTSSKPVLQVRQLLPAFHPHLVTGGALGSGERETEAGNADVSQVTCQAGLGIRTRVSVVLAMSWSTRNALPSGCCLGLMERGWRATGQHPSMLLLPWARRS